MNITPIIFTIPFSDGISVASPGSKESDVFGNVQIKMLDNYTAYGVFVNGGSPTQMFLKKDSIYRAVKLGDTYNVLNKNMSVIVPVAKAIEVEKYPEIKYGWLLMVFFFSVLLIGPFVARDAIRYFTHSKD